MYMNLEKLIENILINNFFIFPQKINASIEKPDTPHLSSTVKAPTITFFTVSGYEKDNRYFLRDILEALEVYLKISG